MDKLVVEQVVAYVDPLAEDLVAEDDAQGDDRDAKVVGELRGQIGGAVRDDPNGLVALLTRAVYQPPPLGWNGGYSTETM